jgi:hypothetical protein
MVLYTDNPGTDPMVDLVHKLATGLGQAPQVRPVGMLPPPSRRQKLLALRGTYQQCLDEVQHQIEVAEREPQRFAAELTQLRAHQLRYEAQIQDCTTQLQQEGGEQT